MPQESLQSASQRGFNLCQRLRHTACRRNRTLTERLVAHRVCPSSLPLMAPLLTLVVIGIGVAIMVGAVRLRTLPVLFLLLLVGMALLPAAVPVVGTLIQTGWHLAQGLPLWLRFVISVLLGITALRLVLSLLLGWRAADEVAADLTTDLIRWAVRVVLYPVRLGIPCVSGGRLFRMFF